MRYPALLFCVGVCVWLCPLVGAQNLPSSTGPGGSIRITRNPAFNPDTNLMYVDGTSYSQLAAAVQACPQTCWIIDSIPETFASDPFAASGTKSVRVTLSRGTWVTDVPITIPTKSQLEGSGRGDSDYSGTVVQAAPSFPANNPVVEMGDASPSFAVRVENLTIDCNNLPGVVGVHNANAQEQSGLRHILVENIAGIGVDIEGSGAQNSGPYEDLEFAGGMNSSVSTASLCFKVVQVPAFRGLHGATCNFNNYSVHPAVGIQMDTSGTLADIHVEGTENGVGVGVSVPGTGAILQNIYGGGPNVANIVHVYSGQNILLFGLVRGSSANVLVDDVFGDSVSDTELALYFIGNGAAPNLTRFSSASATNAQSRLGNLAVSNLSVANAMAQLGVGNLTVANLQVTGSLTVPGGAGSGSPGSGTGAVAKDPFDVVARAANMNVTDGIAVLNARGHAEVTLPEPFVNSNCQFRYQLTPLGGYAPVFVASEMNGHSFRIGGGTPGLRVSWTVSCVPQPASPK